MAVNEWKIWQKLGLVKAPKEEFIDIDRDLKAIIGYFRGVDVKNLLRLYKEFSELRKKELELRVSRASEKVLKNIIIEQIRKYNQILKEFELFELDAGIAAERAKKIAKSLKISAEKHKLEQKWLALVKKDRWVFDWT